VLGILYDIHGNLDALDEVLAEAAETGINRWLLGGDYDAWSPHPLDTLQRLRELDNAIWIRGNGERWLLDPPEDRPEVMESYELVHDRIPDEEARRLFALPAQAELDGVLYVHGSPLADDESFAPEPEEGEERLLIGVRDRTVVFGHSHQQFRRPGPNGTDLLNPGSVGMPLDGDTRAAWAVRRDDGDFEFRRTEYDVERAAAAYRSVGGELGEFFARRIEKGSD
jgi:diadenosine tetraphosphatase ApaH/serine/threonine PP2A family protein phosphatase